MPRSLIPASALDLIVELHAVMVWKHVQQALKAIKHRHHDPDLRLEQVAREVSLSACHLSRVIKLATGRGFVAHVHARRTARARELLAGSNLSIKEIAGHVGYKSVTQLDRHFRRAYGVTPTATRQGDGPQELTTNRKN